MKGDDHADGGLRRASLDSGAGVSERQAQLPSTSYPGSSWLNGFSRLSTHNESGSAAAGANEGESSPAAGWLKKQHAKEDSTRAYFDLPKSETLLDEFVCALQKRVLLQGRIYIFERHVCFSSNVFGYVKKKVIPVHELQQVLKKRNFSFPNSIELRTTKGAKEFFTSFLSRDEAYRLIINVWQQSREPGEVMGTKHGKALSSYLASQQAAAGGALPGGGGQPQGNGNGAEGSHAQGQHADDADAPPEGSGHGGGGDGEAHMHSTPRAVRGGVANGATPPGAGSRGSLELRKSRRGSAEHAPAHSDVGSSGAIGAAASATGPGPAANGMLADAASSAHARSAADAAQAAGKQQQQEEEEDDDDEPAWQALSQPASPISSDYKPLISATLPAASLREAYDKLLSNDCTFYEDFLERCGHRRITVGEWKRHEQLGSVRDVQFISPIKGFGAWGASHAQCYQSHRVAVYSGGSHLVFESVQTMSDIPYSDCFTVDVRWDMRMVGAGDGGDSAGAAAGGAAVQLDIALRIPFTKKCLFRKVIEGTTSRQVQEQYASMVQAATEVLLQAAAVARPLAPLTLGSAAGLATPLAASVTRGTHTPLLAPPSIGLPSIGLDGAAPQTALRAAGSVHSHSRRPSAGPGLPESVSRGLSHSHSRSSLYAEPGALDVDPARPKMAASMGGSPSMRSEYSPGQSGFCHHAEMLLAAATVLRSKTTSKAGGLARALLSPFATAWRSAAAAAAAAAKGGVSWWQASGLEEPQHMAASFDGGVDVSGTSSGRDPWLWRMVWLLALLQAVLLVVVFSGAGWRQPAAGGWQPGGAASGQAGVAYWQQRMAGLHGEAAVLQARLAAVLREVEHVTAELASAAGSAAAEAAGGGGM